MKQIYNAPNEKVIHQAKNVVTFGLSPLTTSTTTSGEGIWPNLVIHPADCGFFSGFSGGGGGGDGDCCGGGGGGGSASSGAAASALMSVSLCVVIVDFVMWPLSCGTSSDSVELLSLVVGSFRICHGLLKHLLVLCKPSEML